MRRVASVVFLCVFLSSPVLADMTVNVTNPVSYANNGGPFKATVKPDEAIGENSVGSSFLTFCLETGITYDPSRAYYYATIDPYAVSGGGGAVLVGGGVTGDWISDETAWLYNNYLDGTLDYGLTPIAYSDYVKGSAVQEAIWRLENEASHSNALAGHLVDLAEAAVDGGYRNGNIMAMNLWSRVDHTGDAQSMLVRVPVPAAALLGMLGLSVAGLRLRKRV